MAKANKKAGANHFALLEREDPGDTSLQQPQAAPASLTQELFGRAYPSAWEVMRNRQKQQQYGAPPPAKAKAKARADSNSKKGAQGQGQGGSARKQQGGRHANGSAAVKNDDAPASRLYDLGEFPSLK